jgi:hypothetical protein
MSKFIVMHDANSDCEGVFNINAIEAVTAYLDGPGTLVQLTSGDMMVVAEEYDHLKAKLMEEMA